MSRQLAADVVALKWRITKSKCVGIQGAFKRQCCLFYLCSLEFGWLSVDKRASRISLVALSFLVDTNLPGHFLALTQVPCYSFLRHLTISDSRHSRRFPPRICLYISVAQHWASSTTCSAFFDAVDFFFLFIVCCASSLSALLQISVYSLIKGESQERRGRNACQKARSRSTSLMRVSRDLRCQRYRCSHQRFAQPVCLCETVTGYVAPAAGSAQRCALAKNNRQVSLILRKILRADVGIGRPIHRSLSLPQYKCSCLLNGLVNRPRQNPLTHKSTLLSALHKWKAEVSQRDAASRAPVSIFLSGLQLDTSDGYTSCASPGKVLPRTPGLLCGRYSS